MNDVLEKLLNQRYSDRGVSGLMNVTLDKATVLAEEMADMEDDVIDLLEKFAQESNGKMSAVILGAIVQLTLRVVTQMEDGHEQSKSAHKAKVVTTLLAVADIMTASFMAGERVDNE